MATTRKTNIFAFTPGGISSGHQGLTNGLLNLKKTAASKRATVPRAADYARAFLKNWQRLSHSGRFDRVRLKHALVLLIANDAPLAPEWLDHSLKGQIAVNATLAGTSC
jgi:hypothetical protein